MAAHQAPLSLGFSRQEYWSGWPCPSPMCESEKWKWSRSVVSNSLRPHGLQPTRLLCPWDFPGKSTGVGCHCLLRTTFIPYSKTFPGRHWGRRGEAVDSWTKQPSLQSQLSHSSSVWPLASGLNSLCLSFLCNVEIMIASTSWGDYVD